ncbi:MAG: prolyl oligopeptidase family serine peptidase, partial [Proteobacteria bacterium]|nr:prolyl oligopeptidase family serine peptidase [Pseudomonadota bacterium]
MLNKIKVSYLLLSVFVIGFCSNLVAKENITNFSIEHFFKRPDIKNIQVSPDGEHIVAVVVRGKEKVAAILNISNPVKPKIIRTFNPPKHEFVSSVFWANNERIIFTTEERQTSLTSPRGTGKFYAGNVDGTNRRVIAGVGKNTNGHLVTGLLDRVHSDKDNIIISSINRSEGKSRVDWLNVNTGNTKHITTTPLSGGSSFVIDHNHEVRFVLGRIEDTTKQDIMYRENEDSEWQSFEHPFEGDINIAGFDGTNRYAYIISDDKNKFGLYQYDTKDKNFKPLVKDSVSTIDGVMWDNHDKEIIAVKFHVGKPHYKFISENNEKAALQQSLANSFPDSFVQITSMSRDSERASILVSSDSNPGSQYLWDKKTNKLYPLGPLLPQIDPQTMSQQKAIVVKTRDGIDLHGYLTYRPDIELKDRPTIVVVHGGPHGPYDRWGWNPETQLFANRGYLVLQINYRGSGGFGEQFMKSGYKKWGVEMQDDITDATRWAIDEGLADPDKICIYGASYGGYAVLSGITREPDLYQCAFAFVGVYDLSLMFESGDIHR